MQRGTSNTSTQYHTLAGGIFRAACTRSSSPPYACADATCVPCHLDSSKQARTRRSVCRVSALPPFSRIPVHDKIPPPTQPFVLKCTQQQQKAAAPPPCVRASCARCVCVGPSCLPASRVIYVLLQRSRHSQAAATRTHHFTQGCNPSNSCSQALSNSTSCIAVGVPRES